MLGQGNSCDQSTLTSTYDHHELKLTEQSENGLIKNNWPIAIW